MLILMITASYANRSRNWFKKYDKYLKNTMYELELIIKRRVNTRSNCEEVPARWDPPKPQRMSFLTKE